MSKYHHLTGAAVFIFDLLGRLIHHEVMTSDRLELDGIPAGVYVVRAEQGGAVREERLVVQYAKFARDHTKTGPIGAIFWLVKSVCG